MKYGYDDEPDNIEEAKAFYASRRRDLALTDGERRDIAREVNEKFGRILTADEYEE